VQVFILDAHSIYRGGLAACLSAFEEVGRVGEAGAEADAKRDPVLLGAEVVIVDARIPGAEKFVRWVSKTTGARVLVSGSRCDESEVLAATRAGAVGFLCKETLTPDALRAAVRAAAVAPAVAPGVLASRRPSFSRLTSREEEVLRLVAAGHPTREVARRLCYSERTIKNVIHDVVTKLNARTRSQAVAEAVREGLI